VTAIDALLAGLQPLGDDVFRPVDAGNSFFGGMLLARALQAAGQTVDDRPPHAIEGRFLQGGKLDAPVDIHVQRLRDGSLLSSRRAEIRQDDATLFTLDASFGRPPESEEYEQPTEPMPALELDGVDEWLGFDESLGFETREHIGSVDGEDGRLMGRTRRVWARPATSPMPGDPLLQAAVLALFSDTRTGMTAMGSIDRPTHQRASSLNHAMWFHRPLTPGWFSIQWTPINTSNRLALVQGSIHASDGTRCASFVQELLLREQQPEFDPPWAKRSTTQ
jgi:acyl-CoA thioesterase II